jgi:hypothetical protein
LTVKYNSETFYLYNNAKILDQKTVTSYCEGSLVWDGNICSKEKSLPDLTAGKISPVIVSVGMYEPFSVTITNQGTVSVGNVFSNLFQIADDASGNNATDFSSIKINSLGANSSESIQSEPYEFAVPGTIYVRACADKSDMGDSGVINELDEDNNCGPWIMVTTIDGSVDGVCSDPQVHYDCDQGNPINQKGSGTADDPWTWTCQGVNGGGDAECTEEFKCPAGLENPPKCDVCINGAENPPECNNIGGECLPGLTPYPDCNKCINGGIPPACDKWGGIDLCPNQPGIQTTGPCKKVPWWREL